MEFTLYYRGHLKANGGPKDKHRLRQHFHGQIKELWKQSPLVKHRGLLDPEGGSVRVGELIEIDEINEDRLTVVRTVGAYKFASVVSSTLDLVADLSITLLRPEPPGAIVTQGGDIDNRLKTLLDALKIPDSTDALPRGVTLSGDEIPFFCLLEDDNLITGINVKTDRLLDPNAGRSEVVLLIHVRTRPTIGTFINLGLV